MLHGRHDRKSKERAERAIKSILCDPRAFSKITAKRTKSLIVGFDLVEEGITQALGVSIPLTRPLVGRKRRRPKRIGAVAAVHRKVKAVAKEELRPFPPRAELPNAAQEIVTVDERGGHVRRHRAEHQSGLDDPVDLANGLDHALFRNVTEARLEHE